MMVVSGFSVPAADASYLGAAQIPSLPYSSMDNNESNTGLCVAPGDAVPSLFPVPSFAAFDQYHFASDSQVRTVPVQFDEVLNTRTAPVVAKTYFYQRGIVTNVRYTDIRSLRLAIRSRIV